MATVRDHTPASSPDAEGISVITSTRRADDPRRGMIYDPATLAALAPVHLHPIGPGRYVMVFSRRWYDATVSESDPGTYIDHSEDTGPGWAFVTASGTQQPVARSYAVPGPTGRTLRAATSRSNTYLYLLSSYGDGARIEHFRYHPERDAVLALASEQLPAIEADDQSIIFDRGLYVDGTDLVVLGAGSDDHRLYVARKSWGRIGVNTTVTHGEATQNPAWRYRSVDGFSTDVTELAPLPMTSHGPVSVARYRDRLFMATVETDGEHRRARVWRRGPVSWHPLPTTVALGSVADDSYLGGTMQFQQQIRPAATTLAVPYITAVRNEGRIEVSWGNWTVNA